MRQIFSSKQAAYLVRTTLEIALVDTGSRAHRAAASMARRPTRMPSNKKPAEGGFEILMVAGAGFEPTTFGL